MASAIGQIRIPPLIAPVPAHRKALSRTVTPLQQLVLAQDMNRMQSEWYRLYLPDAPDQAAGEPGLIDAGGRVRAMMLELAGPADWDAVARVWQGVQVDLALPAPAIAVSGIDGYQLWFSLLEPVPAARAHAFLDALRVRYLHAVAPARIRLLPTVDAAVPRHAGTVPAQQAQSGCWSAFVAPDLAPMFADTPWLDIEPSQDGQADLLSGLQSIKDADFRKALERLGSVTTPATADAGAADTGSVSKPACPDPKRFLLDVMNDAAVALELRVEAAKALLPYFEDRVRR
ncbi:MAG TPA: hypothetical protein VIO81_07650 [Methyloversatilis sp.]